MQNTPWKWCYRLLFLAAIFSVVCIVSFFLVAAAVAVAALFFCRARVMDSILNSTQLLAHWIYSPDVAMQSSRREYAAYQERNRAMFLVIGGMLVFFALVMMIFAGEGGFITGIFLLAVTVFLFIVSRVAPRIALRYALSSPREAHIAEIGIIYEGAVYPFHPFS